MAAVRKTLYACVLSSSFHIPLKLLLFYRCHLCELLVEIMTFHAHLNHPAVLASAVFLVLWLIYKASQFGMRPTGYPPGPLLARDEVVIYSLIARTTDTSPRWQSASVPSQRLAHTVPEMDARMYGLCRLMNSFRPTYIIQTAQSCL